MTAVRVYDLPTRVFHWTFAGLFVAAHAIANLVDDESARFDWHMLAAMRCPTQAGANPLVAFLSFFSAFFSFIVLAGFFFCSFFWSMPLPTCISLAVRGCGCGCSRPTEYAPLAGAAGQSG